MNNNSQKYYKSMFKDYPDIVNVKQLQIMLGGISKKLAYTLLKNNLINSFTILIYSLSIFEKSSGLTV